jgi:cyclopropane-fatty-acyl-phospholipid synthase
MDASGHPETTAPATSPRIWRKWLQAAGRRLRGGRLELYIGADPQPVVLGREGPRAALALRDERTLLRMASYPALRFGEAYMDGAWQPRDGSLLQVLEAALGLESALESNPLVMRAKRLRSRFVERNTPRRSRRNAAHHYDLDFDLYRRFLDEDLHYSCAYFREDGFTLEQAQQAKCAHIAAKLDLKPGARVLDIGCGWGSFAMYLAEKHGARVTGITLSAEQCKVAEKRARARGLSGRVEFRLEDYRATRGPFDAIVSVGMFEHVGRPQYPVFFERARELLADDGTMLLHSIGRSTPPGGSNPWINKYIFPGGYIPAASEVLPWIEKSGLILADLEVWRLHYARTLAAWHERFQRARADIAAKLGERFCRMWEFYLQASEASFRWGGLVVFHFQLIKRLQRLPLTRGYLYAAPGTAPGA